MEPGPSPNLSDPCGSDCGHQEDPGQLLAALFGVLLVLGVFCSGSTVLMAYRMGRRNAARVYVTSLCVSDVIVLCVCMPPLVTQTYNNGVWNAGKTMCHLVTYVHYLTSASTMVTLTLMLIDCFWLLVHRSNSLSERARAQQQAKRNILIVWCLAIIVPLPCLFFSNIYQQALSDGKGLTCIDTLDSIGKLIIGVMLMVTSMLVPFLMAVVLITVIIYSLEWNHSTKSKEHLQDLPKTHPETCSEVDPISAKHKAGTYQLFAALAINFLCIAPLHIESVLRSPLLGPNTPAGPRVQLKSLLTALFYFKSVTYPLLYKLCALGTGKGKQEAKKAKIVSDKSYEPVLCDAEYSTAFVQTESI